MGLVDDIKAGNGKLESTEMMVVEQALNKLFYAPCNPKEELAMLKMQYDVRAKDRCGLHASAILASDNEFCYREQVLSLFYKQAQGENINIELKRIFEAGNSIGEKWQRLFIRGNLGIKEDMDVSRMLTKYDLSYTPDAIITIGKKRYVVEIKSQNTFIFKKSKSHPSGKKQLRFYMLLEKVKHGFVLVEDKNDQGFKLYPEVYGETFSKEEMEPYITRLKQIQVYKKDFANNKIMVPGICTEDSCKRALKCNMRDACFNIGMGRVKRNCAI